MRYFGDLLDMNMMGVSQIDWIQILSWVSLAVAIAAAAGAIASAVIAHKVYMSQTRPDVIAFMDGSPNNASAAQFFIRNIGNGPAYDIEIRIEPELPTHKTVQPVVSDSFITHGVAFLQPGGERRTFLDLFSSELMAMKDQTYSVVVSYTDGGARGSRKRSYKSDFVIDPCSFKGVSADSSQELERMKEISESLKKIANQKQATND